MKLKILIALGLGVGLLQAQTDTVKRLNDATDVIKEIMGTPDKTIPQNLLDRSYCIVVVPGMKKGAIFVGGKYGKGFVSCRHQSGVGWGPPASVRIEGGSIGFQFGGSETDVIMLMMNDKGMDRLLTSQFTLGGDASVAAGPVGRTSTAETDAMMTAEILTWSRTRGIFAGIALTGATLREDADSNQDLYGKKITNREILTTNVAPPKAATAFLGVLNRSSSRR